MLAEGAISNTGNSFSQFYASKQKRAYSVGFIDGLGTGIQISVAGVLVAQRFGLGATGIVFGVGGLGRFFSPALFWWMDRQTADSDRIHRIFAVLAWVMTATSLGVVATAAWGPLWSPIVIGVLWAFVNSSTTIIASSAVPKALVGYGPWAMVGSAIGAVVGAMSFVIGNSFIAALMVAGVLSLQVLEPPLLSIVEFAKVFPVSILETARHIGKGFILASLTYGPLMVYQALTLQVASTVWVGWAMVVYAIGALSAIPFSKTLRGFRTFPSILLLGVVGVGVWSFAFSGPLLLLGRFMSGLFLFVAQGRLLQLSYHSHNGESSTLRLAGMNTGLGLGAAVGAIIASSVAETTSVNSMGWILGLATLVVAVFAYLLGHFRTRNPESAVVSNNLRD